jgi:hypothetical protein
MLSQVEVSRIRAEIEMLGRARDACYDTGIREQIDCWIQGLKTELKRRESVLHAKAAGA